jgi:hypothetical protein
MTDLVFGVFGLMESIIPVATVCTSTFVSSSGKKPDSAFHGAVLLSHTNLGPKLIFWAAQAMLAEL